MPPAVQENQRLMKELAETLQDLGYGVSRNYALSCIKNGNPLPSPLADEHKRERRRGEEVVRDRLFERRRC